ncbi:MAG: radical SAM protein [bacterium]
MENFFDFEKIKPNERNIEEIILEAKNNASKTLESLNALKINVPERHNVLVPGTLTTPENSRSLLEKAVKESGDVSVYAGNAVCPYICKFCRYNNRTGQPENLEQMAANDVDYIIKEMKIVSEGLKLSEKIKTSSVYIGGGTPTLMSKETMRKLFENMHKFYDINEGAEITMECTPDTIDQEKITTMKNFGVNRISMGAQRFDDEWLKSMNRGHSVSDVFNALELFNQNDVNYNIDFIYGFEGQSIESFCDDLNKILKYDPTEITLYRFEDKKRTDDKDIKIKRSNRESAYTMQEAGRIILENRGYVEGPDGWFTKKDAKKAQVYKDRWDEKKPLLGFGAEAYSFSKYQQHTNKPFDQYQEAVQNGEEILDTQRTYEYTDEQADIRRMVFDLKSKFETSFNIDYDNFLSSLSEVGLGEIITKDNEKIFRLNRYGIIAVEEIMRVLIEKAQEVL